MSDVTKQLDKEDEHKEKQPAGSTPAPGRQKSERWHVTNIYCHGGGVWSERPTSGF